MKMAAIRWKVKEFVTGNAIKSKHMYFIVKPYLDSVDYNSAMKCKNIQLNPTIISHLVTKP